MHLFSLNAAAIISFVTIIFVNSKTFNYNITVDTTNILREISIPFYGFTLDFWANNDSAVHGKWYPNAGILTLNLSNENLIALTKQISPAILRIGGSPQDSVVYDINGECNQKYGLPQYDCSETTNTQYYGCINKTRWNQINEFAIKTNVTLIFGLNACYGRNSSISPMNFSNIINLINYTNSIGDNAKHLYGFEFGNELASAQRNGAHRINASIYSNDFYKLYQIINNKYKIIGNDDASPGYASSFINYLNETASQYGQTAKDIIHRLTYHHYVQCEYPNGTLIFSLDCLEEVIKFANAFNDVSNPYGILSWMGEGAEHTGGGTPNVSNTFVDTFYYIYQLCTICKYNINATLRSDLTGGDYELIDHRTFLPNPDYWILYIWKKLIGDAMYDIDLTGSPTNTRAFAFRSKEDVNSIVLVLINFDMVNSAQFDVKVINKTENKYTSNEYYIKPDGSSLQTHIIYVNNRLMEYKNGKFPSLEPIKGNAEYITLPPARIVFVVLTPQ